MFAFTKSTKQVNSNMLTVSLIIRFGIGVQMELHRRIHDREEKTSMPGGEETEQIVTSQHIFIPLEKVLNFLSSAR